MGLEVANYIPELVPSNPAGSDPVSAGDDHIRNLKVAIKNSFSGFVGSTATPKAVTLTEDQINDAALKAALNVFVANQTLSNAVKLLGRNAAADASYRLAEVAASNTAYFGDALIDAITEVLASQTWLVGGAATVSIRARSSGSLMLYDIGGTIRKAGFRNPADRVTAAAAVTVAQSDEGQAIRLTGAAQTVTCPVLEPFTAVTIKSAASAAGTLSGSGTTFRLFAGDGQPSSVSSLTIQAGAIVQLHYSAASVVDVWGSGVSV